MSVKPTLSISGIIKSISTTLCGKKESSIETIKNLYITEGFKWDSEINIFGIRNNTQTRRFDDCIGIIYKDSMKTWKIRRYSGNTGIAALGTYMTSGFHENIWLIGTHLGVNPVLVQRGNKVNGYQQGVSSKGWHGLNCQPASKSYTGDDFELVGEWSEGCQIIQKYVDWLDFIGIIINSKKYKKNSITKFSYLLIDGDKSEIL